MEKNDLFDFMIKSIKETSQKFGDKEPQGFIRWFINWYNFGNFLFYYYWWNVQFSKLNNFRLTWG